MPYTPGIYQIHLTSQRVGSCHHTRKNVSNFDEKFSEIIDNYEYRINQ